MMDWFSELLNEHLYNIFWKCIIIIVAWECVRNQWNGRCTRNIMPCYDKMSLRLVLWMWNLRGDQCNTIHYATNTMCKEGEYV